MKKRMVAMMMGLVMTMTALAGCASSDKTASTEESSKESETQSIATQSSESVSSEEKAVNEIPVDYFAGTELEIAVFRNAMDMIEDYNEKPAFKAAEEATGIHINWIEVEDGTKSEKVNIMLASDMPDAFLGLLNQSNISKNAELFYDLSEEGLLETYAPNVVADYATLPDGMGTVTWPDGSICSLLTGSAVSYNNDADGIMMINKTWLDQLNLDIPTTAEEFYEVMCAFRDNDMNGNGDTTDEIPLGFAAKNWASKIMNHANPWGIAGSSSSDSYAYFMVKDGKVTPTADTDNFRAFLEFYHKLAAEGILDVEGFSQTSAQHSTKIKEGVVGCFYGWSPIEFMDLELAQQYVAMEPFQALEGVEPVKTGRKDRLLVNTSGFAISADTENVEALLHWWNYLSSSTEMKYTLRFGEQGQRWDIDAEGNVINSTPDNLSEGFSAENYGYTYGMVDKGTFITKDECMVIDTSDPTASEAWRKLMVDQVYDLLQDEYIPERMVDPAATEERTFIEADLTSYISNFVATSIMDGVTDASWEAHLEALKNYQYYEWIDWYQKFVDGEY